MNKINLSNEQHFAFNKYIQGENIFITGPGGSGKSELIKRIYNHAKISGKDLKVTAMTGCAALLLNCEARTLHSWASIGIANRPVDELYKTIIKNKRKKYNWISTDVLIVDEVSMMSKKIFELIFILGQMIRSNYKPFGGIQVIFCGDFYQLPPVGNKEDDDTMKFCFESDYWNQTFKKENQIQLTTIFRQSDSTYSDILNQIREGRIKKSSNNLLLNLVGKTLPEDSIIKPTKLFPTKYMVEMVNTNEMIKIDSEIFEYKISKLTNLPIQSKELSSRRRAFTQSDIEQELEYLILNSPLDPVVKLKIGAQVMCTINIYDTEREGILVCNGSQGVITSINNETKLPTVKFNNSRLELTIPQKIQESERIPGIGISQIPLILAWAVTIHKSQGSTIDVAEVDVGNSIFECGQTYVALSRVKSLEGLYLTSYDVGKIKINKKVKDFYENLSKTKVQTINNTEETREELREEKIEEEEEKKEKISFKDFEYNASDDCVICMENKKIY